MAKRTFNGDYKNGRLCERVVLSYLNSRHSQKHQYTLYPKSNSVMDFYSDKYEGELKSRNNEYSKYPTTMIGENKLLNHKEDKKYRYYFLFTDGLYRWKYNKDQYTVKKAGRFDRGGAEVKRHAFIKIEDLQLLTTKINSNTKELYCSSDSEIED
tara:strand:- start:215 stop:679 length:465 start_codon:yes stop_codon:yes gene_type:complete